jgi:hypothetical protein
MDNMLVLDVVLAVIVALALYYARPAIANALGFTS